MSNNGFDGILAGLEQLGRDIEAAAVRGLANGAAEIQATARASAAYTNDSGATRASTVAFVVVGGGADGTVVDAALAEAEQNRPGSGQAVELSFVDRDNPRVVVTAMTNYVEPLVVKYAGQNDFLGPTMDSDAPRLMDAAFAAIEQELKS